MKGPTLRATHRIKPVKKEFRWSMIDPIDWLSETIFSILVFLTFTLAFRIIWLAEDPTQPLTSYQVIDEMLVAAMGAVLAWGIIDGVMYVLISMFERGERHRLLRDIQSAETDQEAVGIIAEDMDYLLEPITDENERQALYRNILVHLRAGKPRQIGLRKDDFISALGHVVVAVVAVIPSVIPLFIFHNNYELAIRVSILVSFTVLFIAGHRWGIYTGANPWKTGLLLVLIAAALVLIAIPLGG